MWYVSWIEKWLGFQDDAEDHEEFLSHFIDLSAGIPSHDTISRVIGALDVDAFSERFNQFAAQLAEQFQGIIAVDGKTMRGSFDRRKEISARHIVSAWTSCCKVALAQVKIDDKSNEITAIPELLSLLDLNNQIVTIDAMGCQRDICQQIIDQEGDYVISLKGNQGTLHQDVKLFLDDPETPIDHVWEEWDKGHGRIENRLCRATNRID